MTLDPDLAALVAAYDVTVDGQPFAWPRGTAAGDVTWLCDEVQRLRECLDTWEAAAHGTETHLQSLEAEIARLRAALEPPA